MSKMEGLGQRYLRGYPGGVGDGRGGCVDGWESTVLI